VVIDNTSWQLWYSGYISYLIGLTSGAALMATMLKYYISNLIGPNCSDAQEWIITFKPWLLPRIQG